MGFVEVVYAPAQPSFGIPPGSITIHMKIPNANDLGRGCTFGTYFRPCLRPAVIGPPEKLKCILPHLPVFELQMLFHNRSAIVHPSFVFSSRNLDFHGALPEHFSKSTPGCRILLPGGSLPCH